ncbi:MAG: alpha/beta hydrolase [Chloroflexota bacterium]
MSRTLGGVLRGLAWMAAAGWLVRASRRRHVQWLPPARSSRSVAGLAVRTTGDRGPPIVLLHGLAASGLVWGAQFEVLGRDHRLVVPDLYGFGDSMSDAGAGFGPSDHVDHVLGCLHELGVNDEPCLVVGHSMGALLALHLAVAHPERVSGVVGFAPPLYRTRAEAVARIGGIDPMARLLALETSAAHRLCQWVCEHRATAAVLAQALRPDLPAPVARAGVRHTWPSYSESLRAVILTATARELLPQIDVPVRLVAGANDHVSPPSLLDGLVGPALWCQVWDGVGHEMILREPDRCVAMILDALGT